MISGNLCLTEGIELGVRAILRRDGRIYGTIIPFGQPNDGGLVAFCWDMRPDCHGRFPTFRHDLDLLGKGSVWQMTRVADRDKAARMAIARAALFSQEHGQEDRRRESTLLLGNSSHRRCR
jgi:hypothetical protein